MEERFTIRYRDHYYCKIKDSECHRYNKDNDVCCCGCEIAEKMIDKLGNYEDLEESLEKTYGKCDGLLEMTVKYLAEHEGAMDEKPNKSILLTDEDAEKWLRWKESEAAGKLINLPCKPGDTVYTNLSVTGWYMRKNKRPYKAIVIYAGLSENPDFNWFNVLYGEGKMWQFKFSDIGKTVFLTEQEAKEALVNKK